MAKKVVMQGNEALAESALRAGYCGMDAAGKYRMCILCIIK